MPSVSDFIVDRATVAIPMATGDDLHVTYRPGQLSQHRIDKFMDALQKHNDVLAASYLLAGYGDGDGIIISWDMTGPFAGDVDMTDDDGNPVLDENGRQVVEHVELVPEGEAIPIAVEYLRHFQAKFLIEMFTKIQEHSGGFGSAFFEKATTISKNGSSTRS